MKAKKLTGAALKVLVIGAVGAFLALHSINLFAYVFPSDQQYLAWLGFGLTGLGAIAYLTMFMWEGSTILQKWVSLAMAFVCSIGEVLAAYFGMQIETWRKAGFQLTESDFQMMLTIIGILAITHFFALIAYFAGDKIAELFGDDDGDGIPNYKDRDYKPNKSSNQPQNAPVQDRRAPHPHSNNGNNPQIRTYNLDGLLQALRMDRAELKSFLIDTETFTKAWQILRNDGRLPKDITHKNFNELCGQVNPIPAAR